MYLVNLNIFFIAKVDPAFAIHFTLAVSESES